MSVCTVLVINEIVTIRNNILRIDIDLDKEQSEFFLRKLDNAEESERNEIAEWYFDNAVREIEIERERQGRESFLKEAKRKNQEEIREHIRLLLVNSINVCFEDKMRDIVLTFVESQPRDESDAPIPLSVDQLNRDGKKLRDARDAILDDVLTGRLDRVPSDWIAAADAEEITRILEFYPAID